MTNYNKVVSAKKAWSKLSMERTKYRSALLYIRKVAEEARAVPPVHADALDAIYKMASEVLSEGDDCEFAA